MDALQERTMLERVLRVWVRCPGIVGGSVSQGAVLACTVETND
jgi:hypothetical protein